MEKRRFNIWLNKSDLEDLKKDAKTEHRSLNGFVLYRILKEKKKNEKN